MVVVVSFVGEISITLAAELLLPEGSEGLRDGKSTTSNSEGHQQSNTACMRHWYFSHAQGLDSAPSYFNLKEHDDDTGRKIAVEVTTPPASSPFPFEHLHGCVTFTDVCRVRLLQ